MAHSLKSTVLRSVKGIVTTSPKTWYRRWLKGNRRTPESRAEYLAAEAHFYDDELIISGWEVMQDWERPIMLACAEEAARNKGHVLEVGFGMGISANFLIERCSQYTCIEPHPDVLTKAREWAAQQPVPAEIVEGFWEDVIDDLGVFDGILFDTFPVSKDEQHASARDVVRFAPKAAEHLRPGGTFSFYGGFPERLPPSETTLIKQHFSDLALRQVSGLRPPKGNKYYHASTMVVPICTK